MVPDTSKHWPYHKTLLVFCLKFRLAPICEYLNYYYNITNDYRAIPEKIQARGLGLGVGEWGILLEKKSQSKQKFPYIFSISMKIPCHMYIYIYLLLILLSVLFFFIDKRWLLKPLPYETCCMLWSFSV